MTASPKIALLNMSRPAAGGSTAKKAKRAGGDAEAFQAGNSKSLELISWRSTNL
jgi:hypothetical protein